jgi:hypothetical protein
MNKIIEEAQKILDIYDPMYDMVSEGDYEYLLEYCKNGQDFINEIKKIRNDMYTYFDILIKMNNKYIYN